MLDRIGLSEENAAAFDRQRGRDLYEKGWLERFLAGAREGRPASGPQGRKRYFGEKVQSSSLRSGMARKSAAFRVASTASTAIACAAIILSIISECEKPSVSTILS